MEKNIFKMVKKRQKNLINRYLESLVSSNIDQTYSLKTFLESMRGGQYMRQKNCFLNICVQIFLLEYSYDQLKMHLGLNSVVNCPKSTYQIICRSI